MRVRDFAESGRLRVFRRSMAAAIVSGAALIAAGCGGGIHYGEVVGRSKIMNSLLADNVAASSGGAILISAAEFVGIENCTVIRNQATAGAALSLDDSHRSVDNEQVLPAVVIIVEPVRAEARE